MIQATAGPDANSERCRIVDGVTAVALTLLDASTDFVPSRLARREETRAYRRMHTLIGRSVPQPAFDAGMSAILVPGFISGDVSLALLSRQLRRAGHRTFRSEIGAEPRLHRRDGRSADRPFRTGSSRRRAAGRVGRAQPRRHDSQLGGAPPSRTVRQRDRPERARYRDAQRRRPRPAATRNAVSTAPAWLSRRDL